MLDWSGANNLNIEQGGLPTIRRRAPRHAAFNDRVDAIGNNCPAKCEIGFRHGDCDSIAGRPNATCQNLGVTDCLFDRVDTKVGRSSAASESEGKGFFPLPGRPLNTISIATSVCAPASAAPSLHGFCRLIWARCPDNPVPPMVQPGATRQATR
jgi:hypothetical protein